MFSPRKAGGDVATRQRGAARAHQARAHPPRRCARAPLCLTASPPQGGGKKKANRIPPPQARMSHRSEIFSPRLRGEMSQRDRGGPPARTKPRAPPQPLRAPPLCLPASPPQGGEKREPTASPPLKPGCRTVRKCSPPALRGEMSQRDRGGPPARTKPLRTPSGAARDPPSAYRHLPPKGGRKKSQRQLPQGGRKSDPPARPLTQPL